MISHSYLSLLYRAAIVILLIFITSPGFGQAKTFTSGRWGIEANYLTGRFLKHGANHVPLGFSHGFEINYYRKTLGERSWHRGMNYPEVGVCFTYFSFADHETYGDAFALMAYAKFFLVRSRQVDFYARLGSGYGLLTRQYDAVRNPNNTLISTPVNMAVQLRLGLEWKLNKYLQLNTAISFNHFSNSGINLPNYGLNMPNATIGIKVIPQPKALNYNCVKPTSFKKNEIMWKLSVGIMQLHSFNSFTPVPTRKYAAPSVLVAYARYVNPGNKFYAGLSWEYFPAIRDYILMNDIHTRYGAIFESSIPSIVVGDEFLLGRFGMFYSVGTYLWKNTTTITPIYFKLGMNIYVGSIPKRKGIKFFLGNNVKAHTNVAQYNEFSVGGTF